VDVGAESASTATSRHRHGSAPFRLRAGDVLLLGDRADDPDTRFARDIEHGLYLGEIDILIRLEVQDLVTGAGGVDRREATLQLRLAARDHARSGVASGRGIDEVQEV